MARMTWVVAAAIALGAAATTRGAAQPSKAPLTPLSVDPASRVWLRGDSTLHPYASTSAAVQAAADFGGEGTFASAVREGRVRVFEVRIPVTSLKSGEKRLDKNLYGALKAGDHPEILYRLLSYERVPGANGAMSLKAQGTLSIAGQDRPAAIEAQALAGSSGTRLRGSYRLRMSEFGVTPPTFMMGVLKVRDPVTIDFDLDLK